MLRDGKWGQVDLMMVNEAKTKARRGGEREMGEKELLIIN